MHSELWELEGVSKPSGYDKTMQAYLPSFSSLRIHYASFELHREDLATLKDYNAFLEQRDLISTFAIRLIDNLSQYTPC